MRNFYLILCVHSLLLHPFYYVPSKNGLVLKLFKKGYRIKSPLNQFLHGVGVGGLVVFFITKNARINNNI